MRSGISRPDMRLMVFECVAELRQLKQYIERDQVVDRDIWELQELFGVLEDMVPDSPADAIGVVLYDESEALAFERFHNYEIDWKRLSGEPGDVQSFLRSPEFQGLLAMACDCFGEMLREGHGIPGLFKATGDSAAR